MESTRGIRLVISKPLTLYSVRLALKATNKEAQSAGE